VHTAELTYAVAAPVDPSVSLRASVDGMNRVLAAALRSLGVGAALVPAGAPTVPVSAGACFGAPSVGEVMVDGQKLAGSAQWRDGGAFLQHGSILIRDDQPLLRAALAPGIVARDVPPAATLAQATAVPAFAAEFGIEVELVASEALLAAGAGDRFAARYGDPAWIWRR
jgi:lipoate-protein ligase A